MMKFYKIYAMVMTVLVLAHGGGVFAATKQFQSSSWVAACKSVGANKVRLCQMSQAVRKVGGNKPLLVVAVQREIKGKKFMLVLRLPHGLNLPAGVQLQIDQQKARRLAVLSSDRGGTFTRVKLSETVLGALKKGGALTISFVTMGGQRFNIPVSLSGFTASLTKLTKLR